MIRKVLAVTAVLLLAAAAVWNLRDAKDPASPADGQLAAAAKKAAQTELPKDDARTAGGEGDSQAAAAPEGARLSAAEFERLAREVSGALPTVASLRAGLTDEEAHGTPAAIEEAGLALGRVARALHDNPELKEAGLTFYEGCASRDDLPKSVRALCYSNLKGLAVQSLLEDDEDAEVTDDVRSLARELEGN